LPDQTYTSTFTLDDNLDINVNELQEALPPPPPIPPPTPAYHPPPPPQIEIESVIAEIKETIKEEIRIREHKFDEYVDVINNGLN